MQTSMNKWMQTMKVAWSNYLAYRLNFFLQMIGPALVFFFVKYNLWTSVFGKGEGVVIQGYTLNGMLQYHFWVMIVSLIGQGHTSMKLAEDIRLGKISTYLIYPFNFWEFHTANFLAFQCLQLGIVLLSVLLVGGTGLLGTFSIPLSTFCLGLGFSLFVGAFWFALQYFLGLMAFWLEETWVLRVIVQIICQFLSGALVPLELFPQTFQKILYWTPFPYLTFVPVKIFMGQINLSSEGVSVGQGALFLGMWFLLLCWANYGIWKKGLRLYTAAGM